jgi:hypothetical protein
MTATLLAPNTGNLRVGKGELKFKRTGDATAISFGNCTDIVLTPDMETLEHFSSLAGIKTRDLVVILSKKVALKFTMEEFTPHNMGIMLLGAVDEAAVGGPEIDIFSESSITGEVTFISNNDIGPKYDVTLYNVSITPTGDFSMISEEWGTMECEADVLPAQSGPTAGKFGLVKVTNIDVVS